MDRFNSDKEVLNTIEAILNWRAWKFDWNEETFFVPSRDLYDMIDILKDYKDRLEGQGRA